MEVFQGISAADGTGIGKAFVIPDTDKRTIPQTRISKEDAAAEWRRFEEASRSVSEEISAQLAGLSEKNKSGSVQKEIFETYLLMLNDPVFLKELRDELEEKLYSMEYTLSYKSEEYAARLRAAGNEYFAARADDITDVFGRVLDRLLGVRPFDVSRAPDGAVIVAAALNATDAVVLTKRKIAGLALTDGGVSSHVAILARSAGIPAVVGLDTAAVRRRLGGGSVIVDGAEAKVIVEPDEKTVRRYQSRIQEQERRRTALRGYLKKPARTKDGAEFRLFANIGTPEEAETAAAEGADGIGLFRTEFLCMSRAENGAGSDPHFFDEDTQFEAYKKVLQVMEGKPVTIRTLDTGGDKIIRQLPVPQIKENNPLMGLRAIRLCLAYPQLLKTQLRALYRAGAYGDLRIMLPLVTSVEQVRQCLEIAETVRKELSAENIPFNQDVRIGVMIETAAAAVISDRLAKVSGFFSIGTNDLTQYTLGVDRENPGTAQLYDECSPAVLRLISRTVQSAEQAGIPVAVCGEMARRRECVPVLGGLGVRNLSMSPKHISEIKELLSGLSVHEMQTAAAEYLDRQ